MIDVVDREVVDYVYDNFQSIREFVTKDHIEQLITQHSDKLIIINNEHDNLCGVGFYYMLEDKSLSGIRDNPFEIGNPLNARYYLTQKGGNMHFIFVVSEGIKWLLKGVRQAIKREEPKTISWFSPDMKQFFIIRRKSWRF